MNDPQRQERFNKEINPIGLMEPREVAEGFYKLVTQCGNGSVMAVAKGYPVFLIPDYGSAIVLSIGFIASIVGKLTGVEVVKPIHQVLSIIVFIILLFCFAGWIL